TSSRDRDSRPRVRFAYPGYAGRRDIRGVARIRPKAASGMGATRRLACPGFPAPGALRLSGLRRSRPVAPAEPRAAGPGAKTHAAGARPAAWVWSGKGSAGQVDHVELGDRVDVGVIVHVVALEAEQAQEVVLVGGV